MIYTIDVIIIKKFWFDQIQKLQVSYNIVDETVE